MAMEHGRRYPYRKCVTSAFSWTGDTAKRWAWPNIVVTEGYGAFMLGDGVFHDDRPILAPYLGGDGLKLLHDPLTGGTIDFGTTVQTMVATDYMLWFGVRYTNSDGAGTGGGAGMYRIGDRFEWQHAPDPMRRYSVLASDQDVFLPTGGFQKVWSSHPDKEDKLYFLHSNNPPGSYGARWERTVDELRAPIDHNYAYTDGSVRRLNDTVPYDQRMSRVPLRMDGFDDHWNQLPDNP